MSLVPSFLVVDKPAGITSHDVVDILRAVTGIKKVGHTGTLDPFATGVLPLALGPATRLIQFLDESIKVYDATIQFGTATDTGDPTGQVVDERPLPTADRAELDTVLRGFLGERQQVPHAYSAVKHKGKPLYHYARQGMDVEVKARPITLHDLDVLHYDGKTLRLTITCSRGTYARVLATEIAEALGSTGHLIALSRPRSGPFRIQDAIDMPSLASIVSAEEGKTWQQVLLTRGRREERVPWTPRDQVCQALEASIRRPLDVMTHLPLAEVSPADGERIRKGSGAVPAPSGLAVGGRYLIVCGPELVAVGEMTPRGPQPLRVI